MIRSIIAGISLLVVGATLLVVSLLPQNAGAQSKINGNQLVFVIGSGSNESFFTIKDESRGRTQYWVCGFIHNFTPNGFGGYTPSVQCNREG
jgi:hypothetical protein